MIKLYEESPEEWVADREDLPGSPIVGRGTTPLEALGALFWHSSPHERYTEEALEAMRQYHPNHCWDTAR
jgi:hypothetical protein